MQVAELMGGRMMDPERLEHELRSGRNVIIVDIRPKEEFALGHIPGARSIPAKHLLDREAELHAYRSDVVVIVSARGNRARSAANTLTMSGFTDIQALAGGMDRWCALRFPTVQASVIPPSMPSSRLA